MQIQTIEEKTGLDRATIRYYEKEGLIHPQRLQNGYRDYSQREVDNLMKIKLLRQLGLSLEAIQHLSVGKEDLHAVLESQLVILNAQKEHIDTAEALCKMIMQDNATYQTMQPLKYIDALNRKQIKDNRIIDMPVTEYVSIESHPFRRFIGRYLDQIVLHSILLLIIAVIVRVRPFGEIQIRILSVAVLFLAMPINALFLSLFGTTPGKFAFGIHLKTPEGKKPSFVCAMRREWSVFRYGCGFYLPIFSLIRLFKSYKIHTTGQELEWDYDTDVIYREWGTGKLIYSVILFSLCIFSVFYSTMDAQFPKHRNEDLTIGQFSENFNDYAKQNNMMIRLSEEGEWYPTNSSPTLDYDVTIEENIWDTNIEESWNFEMDENHKIICIQMVTNSRFFFNEKFDLILYTAIMSQPNAKIKTAREALHQFSQPIIISDFDQSQYDFNGVIVNIQRQPSNNSEVEQDKLLVEIIFP